MKKLLAIDPGPVQSAYVVWDGAAILEHGIVCNPEMLEVIRQFGRPWNQCAVEMIASYGMPVGAEVFETCVMIGRILQTWGSGAGEDPIRIKRIEVKNHLCHTSKANDANIRQVLVDILGPPGTKKNPGVTYGIRKDEWAALAVAITVWDMNKRKEQA